MAAPVFYIAQRPSRIDDRPHQALPRLARAAPAITLPITEAGVDSIASPGSVVTESIAELQLRNYRVTLAYGNLSDRLATMTAGSGPGPRLANWCSFATWSSKTIGDSINRRPDRSLVEQIVAGLPAGLRTAAAGLAERFLTRDNGGVARALAAGNRFVFLEIGTCVARLLETAARSDLSEASWTAFWPGVERFVGQLADLGRDWMGTRSPDRQLLRRGLHAYWRAATEPDTERRKELVLAANLALGAYEQRRVQGYLAAGLSLSVRRPLELLERGASRAKPSAWLRLLDRWYATLMTRRFIALQLPNELLWVGRPVPPPPVGREGGTAPGMAAASPSSLEDARPGARRGDVSELPLGLQGVVLPELRILLRRYDRSRGVASRTAARDWARFGDRMNYITALFRSRLTDEQLLRSPWSPAETSELLAGQLPA